ncbi:MAG TPA: phosphopantetheine-binding protein [Candidatus Eisenbacteria bacterium]|nr:phosphopantetheine-binding protein [Candidatus Eisenbacteria bacterium]
MDRSDVRAEVKKLLIKGLRLTVSPQEIVDEAPIFGQSSEGTGLGLDSIDALELVVLVEERFNVTIADEDTGKRAFASVAALADFISEARAA